MKSALSTAFESSRVPSTPAIPMLYFKDDDSVIPNPLRDGKTNGVSLRNLPPELLHRCLTLYADWGDLAKLACVQKGWKNLVHDAAAFGGRDATWELSMLLLDGTASIESSNGEEGVDRNNDMLQNNDTVKNQRGLLPNETLAVKYLTRLSGVEINDTDFDSNANLSIDSETKSYLPNDWSGKANSEADESALLALAQCYLTGTGVKQPNAKFALHYLQAAYHYTRSVKSAYKLALMYEYPKESNNLIQIDVYAAFEWFRAAAELGHVPSMAELALCYELGCGTVQNDTAALDWYMKAANSGHGASHYSVGEHYEEARGVPHDEEEACLWYHRAAILGEEDGVSGLKRLRHVARRVLSANNLQELAEQHELVEILHE
ncbi:hypothetical protein HJC23_011226 [Cyclotella cryptica]|uniref:F-box domain-containing protein n=1 Tax=Cyclotella cryptica TaxID=29204 RepID=A0ABD3PXI7_9STRA